MSERSGVTVAHPQKFAQAPFSRGRRAHQTFRHARQCQFPASGRKHRIRAERMARLCRVLSRLDPSGDCRNIRASADSILAELRRMEAQRAAVNLADVLDWSRRTLFVTLADLRAAGIMSSSGARYQRGRWRPALRVLYPDKLAARESCTLSGANPALNKSTTNQRQTDAGFGFGELGTKNVPSSLVQPQKRLDVSEYKPFTSENRPKTFRAILAAFHSQGEQRATSAALLAYFWDRFEHRENYNPDAGVPFPVAYFVRSLQNFRAQFDEQTQHAIARRYMRYAPLWLLGYGVKWNRRRKQWQTRAA